MRSLVAVFFGSAAVALGQSGAPVNLSISSQFHIGIGEGFTLSSLRTWPISLSRCAAARTAAPQLRCQPRRHRPQRQLEPAGEPLRRVWRARGRSG